MEKRITVKAATELFTLDAEARNLTPHSLRFYRTRFRLILSWLESQDVTYLDDVSPAVLRAYLAELNSRGLSPAYVHSMARCVRAFLNYCERDELLDTNPFDKVKMPKSRTEVRRTLTIAQSRALLDACKYERDRAILCVLLDTGMRAGELLALNIGDLDGETVTVRADKSGHGRFVYTGKRTQLQVRKYLAFERDEPRADQPLFTSQKQRGERLRYGGLAGLFRRLSIATGIEVSAHDLRRTFAVEHLRAGTNIYTLARLMGHADITVLQHYLRLTDGDIRAATQAFGVVDRLSRK